MASGRLMSTRTPVSAGFGVGAVRAGAASGPPAATTRR